MNNKNNQIKNRHPPQDNHRTIAYSHNHNQKYRCGCGYGNIYIYALVIMLFGIHGCNSFVLQQQYSRVSDGIRNGDDGYRQNYNRIQQKDNSYHNDNTQHNGNDNKQPNINNNLQLNFNNDDKNIIKLPRYLQEQEYQQEYQQEQQQQYQQQYLQQNQNKLKDNRNTNQIADSGIGIGSSRSNNRSNVQSNGNGNKINGNGNSNSNMNGISNSNSNSNNSIRSSNNLINTVGNGQSKYISSSLFASNNINKNSNQKPPPQQPQQQLQQKQQQQTTPPMSTNYIEDFGLVLQQQQQQYLPQSQSLLQQQQEYLEQEQGGEDTGEAQDGYVEGEGEGDMMEETGEGYNPQGQQYSENQQNIYENTGENSQEEYLMDDDYYNSEYDYQDREMEGEGSVAGDGSVGAQGSTQTQPQPQPQQDKIQLEPQDNYLDQQQQQQQQQDLNSDDIIDVDQQGREYNIVNQYTYDLPELEFEQNNSQQQEDQNNDKPPQSYKNTQKQFIAYDEFVDKYKNGDIRWKDPQIMFIKANNLELNVDRVTVQNNDQSSMMTIQINSFADLTMEEFRAREISRKPIDAVIRVKFQDEIKDEIMSSSQFDIDWSCLDTSVPRAGNCQATHAFAVTSTIQITMRIHELPVVQLSSQELISCFHKNNNGCQNQNISDVYQYVKNSGVGPQSQYPYENALLRTSVNCNSKILKNRDYFREKVFVESYGRVEKGNCAEVVYRLRFRALTVLVDSDYLKFYRNGVIHTEDEVTPDHAVTLVGYDPDTEQFKFKNSWGSNWGINGYGYCTKSIGVCDYAIYPIFSKEKALPKMVCSRR